MTRLEIYRLLQTAGPMTGNEIANAFPGKSRKAVLNRLSEMVSDGYEGLEISRVCRGIYKVGK
jgi:DNA-binding Lrp family transcriptional regulator